MGCHNFINLHDNNLIQITARQKHHIKPTRNASIAISDTDTKKELVINAINLKKSKICEELSIYCQCNFAMSVSMLRYSGIVLSTIVV